MQGELPFLASKGGSILRENPMQERWQPASKMLLELNYSLLLYSDQPKQYCILQNIEWIQNYAMPKIISFLNTFSKPIISNNILHLKKVPEYDKFLKRSFFISSVIWNISERYNDRAS